MSNSSFTFPTVDFEQTMQSADALTPSQLLLCRTDIFILVFACLLHKGNITLENTRKFLKGEL